MIRALVFSALLLTPITSEAAEGCQKPSLCHAYWQGWEFDHKKGICIGGARSGCANPFSYETARDCTQAHGAKGSTCQANWTGYEFNFREGRCQSANASGCRNPFRFRTIEQCQKHHPELFCLAAG